MQSETTSSGLISPIPLHETHKKMPTYSGREKECEKKVWDDFPLCLFSSISFASFFSLNLWEKKKKAKKLLFGFCRCIVAGDFVCARKERLEEKKVQMMKHFVIFAMRIENGDG